MINAFILGRLLFNEQFYITAYPKYQLIPIDIVHTNVHTLNMKIKGIYWDDGNMSHCQKHGVSIAEIEYVLHRVAFRIPDPFPNEPRYRTAGETAEGRYVFIVYMEHTKDNEIYLRPISTR